MVNVGILQVPLDGLRAIRAEQGGGRAASRALSTAQARGREVYPSPEGALEWVKQDHIVELNLVEDLPVLLPKVLAMRPDDSLFFARYHYDEHERLVIAFADQ